MIWRELRLTLKALGGGWPGLLLFALIILVALMINER
jgi:hypothetical protein